MIRDGKPTATLQPEVTCHLWVTSDVFHHNFAGSRNSLKQRANAATSGPLANGHVGLSAGVKP